MQVAHPLRDGLWDDDETTCASPSSSGMSFGWQSRAVSSASVETMSTTRAKSFRSINSKKDDSKTPKGKGRRGELKVNLDGGAAYNGPSLPTIVSPSETLSSASAMSPAPLKSPGFHRPLPLPSSPSFSPVTPSTAASTSSKPSTWAQRAGQSIKRFGRSKSSGNLRVASDFDKSKLPPVPSRPPALGLSHSTPPLGESSKVNQQPRPEVSRGRTYKRSFSPPPAQPTVAVSYNELCPSSPLDIPSDPFSSPFYTPEEPPLQLSDSVRSRSKGLRSPSLRDMRMPSLPSLRDFRPTLSKTKSWASFRNASGPTSAPPEQTSFFPPVPSSFSPASLPLHNHHLACSSPLPKESPPLLPPNPPYFPISNSPLQSPFLPSTPPPASPLPLTPSSSTPVLLPRSRSTSVSLKAPPTSSSFFDLYEQLGIWPSAEEQAKKIDVETPTPEVTAEAIDIQRPPVRALPSLPSKSSDILSASWEKAIGSFPFVDSPSEGHDALGDEEDPGNVADTSLSTVDQVDWLQTPADAGDEQHMYRQRESGQSERKGNGWAGNYRAPVNRNPAPRRRSGSSSSSDASGSRHRMALGSGSEESETDSGEDSDDVPLGQRIPGAVDVQRDLRAKERAKRHKRKKLVSSKAPKPRPVPEGIETVEESSKQWNGEGGVAAEVLRRKLEAVVSLGPVAGPSVLSPKLQGDELIRKASQRQADLSHRPTQNLRTQRSFTNPQTSPSVGADLARRHTDRRSGPSSSRAPPMPANAASTSSSMSRRDKAPIGLGLGDFVRRTGDSDFSRLSAQGADSSEMRSRQRSHSGSQPSAQSSRKPSLAPIVTGASRVESPVPSPRLRSTQKSPMPYLANEESQRQRSGSSANTKAPLALAKPEILRQQRAFVGSLQGKALQLQISQATRARDILDWAIKEGELSPTGDEWVMYEVFAELGCERPLREFELLTDVMHGWNQEARVNTFLFRQSRAAGKTLARAIPRVPPYVGAYVQYESKKGKWSKRWLETREGSVFLAKNDRQKDETFICLAASFDVYAMTRPYKAPKSFTFVLKSQDSAVLFEDPTDYLHIFSSEDSTAHKMIDAIFQARSTSLIIDKPQLLHAIPATRPVLSPDPQRSQSPEVGTVRTGFLGRRKTTKPLVEVSTPAPKSSSPFTGGLLGRRV